MLEMDNSPQAINWEWDSKAVHFCGLQPSNLYTLSCWNLLLPHTSPVEIKIPLVTENTATTTIPLTLPTGIYYIQLLSSQQLSQNLGWWCGSDRYELPEEAKENENLENYCYTVLDNSESKEEFLSAVKNLSIDCDRQRIQTGISALENNNYYFPEWLSQDALLGKLKGLLELLSLPSVTPVEPPIPLPVTPVEQTILSPVIPVESPIPLPVTPVETPSSPPVTPVEQTISPPDSGNWYLVNVRQKKRDLFLKCLKIAIEQNKLQDLILAVETPKDSVYEDIVLLNLVNFKAARIHIQKVEYCQRIEPKPLPSAQVSRMLEAR